MTTSMPFAQAQLSEFSLSQWANENLLLNSVPGWALEVIRERTDEIAAFDEKHIIQQLFLHKELRGVETTAQNFVSSNLVGIVEEIPHAPKYKRTIEEIWRQAARFTGTDMVNPFPKTQVKRDGRNHPYADEYALHLKVRGRNEKYIARARSMANMFFKRWLPILSKFQVDDWTKIKLFGLTRTDVQRILSAIDRKKRTEEMTQSTAATTSTAILSFLKFCIARYGIPDVVTGLQGFSPEWRIDWWIPTTQDVENFFRAI